MLYSASLAHTRPTMFYISPSTYRVLETLQAHESVQLINDVFTVQSSGVIATLSGLCGFFPSHGGNTETYTHNWEGFTQNSKMMWNSPPLTVP